MTPSLVYAGLAMFAIGSARHGPAALGRRLSPSSARVWRIGGSLMLGLSLVIVLHRPGWRIGLVDWFGCLAAAALLVTLVLIVRARWLPGSAMLAIGGALVASLGPPV
jgi:hypothetical protein